MKILFVLFLIVPILAIPMTAEEEGPFPTEVNETYYTMIPQTNPVIQPIIVNNTINGEPSNIVIQSTVVNSSNNFNLEMKLFLGLIFLFLI